jgi:hypothetical protein
MTTATATRVPVRTWQEKALVASAICNPLNGLWEGFDGHAGFVHDHLLDRNASDRLIDSYFARRPEIVLIEGLLRTLRDVEPGPDAALTIPGEFDIVKALSDEIDHMTETDVNELVVDHPSRRAVAEAIIVAIDLLDELVGADA